MKPADAFNEKERLINRIKEATKSKIWGVEEVKSFIKARFNKVMDWLLACKAGNLILFVGVLIAGGISLLFWGPIRWFFMSFVPPDAWGGWVAKLIITIIIGIPFGTIAPLLILILTVVAWAEASR